MSGNVIPTLAAIDAERAARKACRWYSYYPDEGQFRRALYPKHLAFFKAGSTWRQRLFLAANRIGKTDVAAYELTCHLTGLYPPWWQGRRFEKPIECWASGDTSGTARDIIQVALLGPLPNIESRQWSGMIPRPLVYDYSRKQGLPSAIHSVWVRHVTGGISSLDIKSYDQKRESFQGTTKDVIWLDEEPPDDIYGECLIRTMTSNGLILVTMTPLMGLTPFLSEWLQRSALEVLSPTGESQLQHAHAAVFGDKG
jgi:phage terminase large subunit-like protein